MHAPVHIDTFAPPSNARTMHLTDVPIGEVRFRLNLALGQEGFGILAEIDLGDTLSRRLDEQRAPYFIYEVCHPKLAAEALAVASDAGLLMPCKICVWEEGKRVAIATLPPARLVAALGRPHLDAVADEMDARLGQVFERMTRPAAAAWQIPPRAPRTLPEMTADELTTLREATERQIKALLAEAAGTESHLLQHAIARDIERLESIARKLSDQPARIRAQS